MRIKGFLLLPIFALTACTGKNDPVNRIPAITLQNQSQCISGFRQTITRYFRGDVGEGENRRFWDCLASAANTFAQYTEGKSGDRYQARELQRFVEDYFLGELKLSDELVAELFEVKRVIVGGSTDSVTRGELRGLIQVLHRLRDITSGLIPSMKVFAIDPTPEQLDQTLQQLKTAARQMAEIFSSPESPYTFTHLQQLADEIIKLVDEETAKSFQSQLPNYALLFAELKSLLVSPSGEQIEATDWPRFFNVLAEGVGVWFRYAYFVRPSKLDSPQALEQLGRIWASSMSLLSDGINQWPSAEIPVANFVSLANTLQTLEGVNLDIDPKVIERTFKIVLKKLLQTDTGEVFRPDHLRSLDDQIKTWMDAQSASLTKAATGVWPQNQTPGGLEMARVVSSPWPLVLDEQGRLIFSANTRLNVQSLSRLNGLRAAIRLLVQGYAKDPSARNQLLGLTRSELKSAVKDFTPIATALGVMEPGQSNWDKTIFEQANLFLPRSNGDEVLNFEEAIEFFSYLLSGVASQSLVTERLTVCGDAKTGFSAPCAREVFAKDFEELMANTPDLVSFFRRQNPSQFRQFEMNLEAATRAGGASDQNLTTGDITAMWTLIEFIETQFMRFDLNGSGTINVPEAIQMYPIYRGTLANILSGFQVSDDELLAFFTYLLNYGETPFTGWVGPLRWLNWKWHKNEWQFEADRLRIAQTLAALAAQ